MNRFNTLVLLAASSIVLSACLTPTGPAKDPFDLEQEEPRIGLTEWVLSDGRLQPADEKE